MKQDLPFRNSERQHTVSMALLIGVVVLLSWVAVWGIPAMVGIGESKHLFGDPDFAWGLLFRLFLLHLVVSAFAWMCDVGQLCATLLMVVCGTIFIASWVVSLIGRIWDPPVVMRIHGWLPLPKGPDESGFIEYVGHSVGVLYAMCLMDGTRKFFHVLVGFFSVFWKAETGLDLVFIGTVSGTYVASFDWDWITTTNGNEKDVTLNFLAWTCTGMLLGMFCACIKTGIFTKAWYWYCVWILTPWMTCVQFTAGKWLFGGSFVVIVSAIYISIMVFVILR